MEDMMEETHITHKWQKGWWMSLQRCAFGKAGECRRGDFFPKFTMGQAAGC
jgi:hypothetical protein